MSSIRGAEVQGQHSGVRFQGSGFKVQGSGFSVGSAGFRVQGSGFEVEGSRFVDRILLSVGRLVERGGAADQSTIQV